ncbi:ABC transporter permease [Pseudanabaena biceps]|nr:ABC transporter permease [Pseudanabaena biceps]
MFLSRKRRSSKEVTGEIVTRIQATRGWGKLNLDELWQYRDLIYFLLWREINGRYKQMALGSLWLVLQPLYGIVLNTLVFGVLAKLPSDGLPYPLFNYAAMLPWTFFSGALTRSAGSLSSNQGLISKVYFPRLVVAIVAVLSGLLDFLVSFGLLLMMMLYFGFVPGIAVLTLPLFFGLAITTALGIGLCLASLQAWFRDVGFMLNYILQAWLYLTPVVYSSAVVPEKWRFIYFLNPMATVVEGFRWALLGSANLDWFPALISVVESIFILWIGAYLFRRTERTIVDIV